MSETITCTGQCRDGLPLGEILDDGRDHDEKIHARIVRLAEVLTAAGHEDATLTDVLDIDGMPVLIEPGVDAGGSLFFSAYIDNSVAEILEVPPADEHEDGQLLGHLVLTIDPWTVNLIETNPMYVRRGVASALYRNAVRALGAIDHSTSRTPHGDSWAHSVGGLMPANTRPDYGVESFMLWNEYLMENQGDGDATEIVVQYFPDAAYYLDEVSAGEQL